MQNAWYVLLEGKEIGPFTPQQLKEWVAQGRLAATDLVRRADMNAPTPAGNVKGLFAQQPAQVSAHALTPPQPPPKQEGPAGFLRQLSKSTKVAVAAGCGTLLLFSMCCGGVALMMAGKNGDKSERDGRNGGKAPPAEALKVSATQLFQDYQANEVAADEKYKQKTLEITGTVDSIGKDILNTIYVTLQGSGGQFEIFKVQCFFDNKHKGEAAKLSKGQQLTVRGRCDGKFGNVIIKNCQFVP